MIYLGKCNIKGRITFYHFLNITQTNKIMIDHDLLQIPDNEQIKFFFQKFTVETEKNWSTDTSYKKSLVICVLPN